MRKTISLFISLLLLISAFNIAAQSDMAIGNGPSDETPRRQPQPARLSLPADRAQESLDQHSLFPSSTVTVDVDAIRVIRAVDPRIFGINAAMWDSSFESQTTVSFLESTGAKLLRFPGGSLSNQYNWQTNTTLDNTWTWVTSFDDFASIAKAVNSEATICVNYGTGTADEAAAWVEYSNITKGYGFKYWEIGNENYGTWETDNHPLRHDPFTYATEAKDYLAKMKAKDPTIKVGVVIVTGEDSFVNNRLHPARNPRTGIIHNGWTPVMLTTLKSLNAIPDFVIYHRYEQNPGQESDLRLLQSAATWKSDAADLRQQLRDYLGSDSDRVEIVCTENNSVSFNPGKQITSLVNGLFLADSFGNILQTEFNMFVWWDLRNGPVLGTNNSSSLYGWRQYGDYGIVSVYNEPYPSYYVFKLLSHFAAPSDNVIEARSQSSLLAAYATRKADGRLSLMLINKSPTEEITAKVGLNGFAPSSSAVVYCYGKAQDEAARTLAGSPDIAQSVFGGASSSFDYTVPPYSVAVISLLPQTADFELAVAPSSQRINFDGEAEFDITAAFADDFNEPVSITAQTDETAPFDVTITEPNLTRSQSATLRVSPQSNIQAEAYNISVKAVGGGVERMARITVTLLDPPVISAVKYKGRKMTITVSDQGELPRVFINGVDRTDRIKANSGAKIKIKGDRAALGVISGNNRIRVLRGQAASSEFILRH